MGEYLDKKFEKQQLLKPDLVCLSQENSNQKLDAVIIEFKRPSIIISLEDLTQVLKYKSLINEQMPNISKVTAFVIGKNYTE